MGRHYVPQRYLHNFEIPGREGFVWLHDKQTGKSHPAAIEKVAQSKRYYSDDAERRLTAIETPANGIISKLLNNDGLTATERVQLTVYIGTMIKRVPYRRRKALEMYPEVLSGTVQRLREEIVEAARDVSTIGPELVARGLDEVEAIQARFQQTPPAEVVQQIRDPWPSLAFLGAIHGMTWRILVTPGPTHFMTCDNPAFFFEAYGLATPEAELSFPLSPTRALHGCWQSLDEKLIFLHATERLVREINRRLASTTERLAFSHGPADWIMPTLRKPKPYLSVIRW